MRFSERYGYKPVREVLQVESMDDTLRNLLWNVVYSYITYLDNQHLIQDFWTNHLKSRIDDFLEYGFNYWEWFRDYFFSCEWREVYDLIEFIADHRLMSGRDIEFRKGCNAVLKQELGGYQFVNSFITPITQPQEIAAIEAALQETDLLPGTQTHLSAALQMLSDRQNPDYRNSIKESISAVEALVCLIAENPKGTLGQAINAIVQSEKLTIHPDQLEAFRKLYHYTSDEDGIRHKILEQPNLSLADAKYMLASCASFVSYLIAKCAEAGISLNQNT
jgi:hypothetical protein